MKSQHRVEGEENEFLIPLGLICFGFVFMAHKVMMSYIYIYIYGQNLNDKDKGQICLKYTKVYLKNKIYDLKKDS